jgi:hypothetical protein
VIFFPNDEKLQAEIHRLNRKSFIREMPKTLEDVADLGSYICALDKG